MFGRRTFFQRLAGWSAAATVPITPAPSRGLVFQQPQCPRCSSMPAFTEAIPDAMIMDYGERLRLFHQEREITCRGCQLVYRARFAREA